MLQILKPLFTYKKYLLANKLLNEASKCHATFTGTDTYDAHQKGYLPIILRHYFKLNPNKNPERILEAIDILTENKHVTKFDNQDIYRITFKCTVIGERANNEGFYLHKAYKDISLKVGILSIGTPILVWILTKLPILIKSMHG